MALCKLSKAEKAELQPLVDAFESARSELADWLLSVQGEWESAIEEKSEKWRESEAGQEAQSRLDTLGVWLDELPEEMAIDVDQVG
jgi:hypothetical protein